MSYSKLFNLEMDLLVKSLFKGMESNAIIVGLQPFNSEMEYCKLSLHESHVSSLTQGIYIIDLNLGQFVSIVEEL